MISIRKLLRLIVLSTAITSNASGDIEYKSFDESMSITKGHQKSQEYLLLEKIYEKNNPKALGNKKRNTIPKIIHQIWLGPKQIPANHLEYSKKWQQLHPDWEYKLWTEKDIENWNFSSKDLFNKASSYQERSNLLRYEILIKYGGLYLDFDYKPFKNFDDVHSKYDFYGTTEPIIRENGPVIVTDALVASVPNNKIFIEALKDIRSHWDSVGESFVQNAKTKIKSEEKLIFLGADRCMTPFGKSVIKHIDPENSIIFPTSYMGIVLRDKPLAKIREFFGMKDLRLKSRTIYKETMAGQRRGERLMSNLLNIEINEPWYKKVLKKVGIT